MTPEELSQLTDTQSRALLRLLALCATPDDRPVELGFKRDIFGDGISPGRERLVQEAVDELVSESEFGWHAPIMANSDRFKMVFRLLGVCHSQHVISTHSLVDFPISYEGFVTAIVKGLPTNTHYITRDGEWRILMHGERDPRDDYIARRDPHAIHTRREQERVRTFEDARQTQHLKRLGFPYSASFSEYMRFLETNFSGMQFGGQWLSFDNIRALLFPLIPNRPNFKKAHTYIVGRSGSGKSELLKAIYAMSARSRIVIDPHGDLSREIASFTNGEAYRIAPHEAPFVINPFELENLTASSRELVAQEITNLMAELVEDSGLSRLMTTIIFPIVYTLLKLDYADFSMLTECINPNSGKERLGALRHLVEAHHRTIWTELESDTYDTSKQSVFNRLQSLLNYQLVIKTTSGRDDFGRAMEKVEKGASLIISLPIPVMGEAVAVTLGRFFMTRLQIWAKSRQSTPENERVPVILLVDEFHNFLSHGTAQTLDQFGRKFRLFMVLAHQHIQQITDRELRGAVLANTANKIAGISNAETRQAIAREMMIAPEFLEDLRPGNFFGRFGNELTTPFYARRVRNGNEQTPYFPSRNAWGVPDPWTDIAPRSSQHQQGDTQSDAARGNAPATPKKGGYTPKFDI